MDIEVCTNVCVQLPATVTRLLLSHFKWDREKLMERSVWLDTSDAVKLFCCVLFLNQQWLWLHLSDTAWYFNLMVTRFLQVLVLATVFSFLLNFLQLFAFYYRIQWTAEGSVFSTISRWIFCSCMKYFGEPLNGFAPNSQRRRVWSLAWTSLKVKVKGQGHQGQKWHFLALSTACMQFVLGKTSLAASV